MCASPTYHAIYCVCGMWRAIGVSARASLIFMPTVDLIRLIEDHGLSLHFTTTTQ